MTERQHLERQISTLLQTIDSLETQAEDPSRAEALARELTHVDMTLTTTVRRLRELGPDAPAYTSLPAGRRSVRKPARSYQPSTNAYLPKSFPKPG